LTDGFGLSVMLASRSLKALIGTNSNQQKQRRITGTLAFCEKILTEKESCVAKIQCSNWWSHLQWPVYRHLYCRKLQMMINNIRNCLQFKTKCLLLYLSFVCVFLYCLCAFPMCKFVFFWIKYITGINFHFCTVHFDSLNLLLFQLMHNIYCALVGTVKDSDLPVLTLRLWKQFSIHVVSSDVAVCGTNYEVNMADDGRWLYSSVFVCNTVLIDAIYVSRRKQFYVSAYLYFVKKLKFVVVLVVSIYLYYHLYTITIERLQNFCWSIG
jgi:hypothetical protein